MEAGSIGLGPHAVVMVDADGVVAEAHESLHNHVGVLVREILRVEAEVDAVEALFDAGKTLEFKMPVYGLQPSVLAGGSVLEA